MLNLKGNLLDFLLLLTSHGGDSGTKMARRKDPTGNMHVMYMIDRQWRKDPNIYVNTVPNKQNNPRHELNVVLHFMSEISAT